MINPKDLIAKFQYALDNKWGYIWGTAGIKWTQKQQDEATRQQTKDFGQKWVGKMVADCSGLFSWAFKQLGGYMYHGSNTMYSKYCTANGPLKNGRRTDGHELKPGTALFTGNSTDRGHVGLYIGDGWVIEAQGTKAGVVKSKASLAKWTWWGELKGVDYGEKHDEIPVQVVISPTIPGSKAKVTAPTGMYVKMRKEPSRLCKLYDDIPVGAEVQVVEPGDTWTKINFGKRKGWYMMTKFLKMI